MSIRAQPRVQPGPGSIEYGGCNPPPPVAAYRGRRYQSMGECASILIGITLPLCLIAGIACWITGNLKGVPKVELSGQILTAIGGGIPILMCVGLVVYCCCTFVGPGGGRWR